MKKGKKPNGIAGVLLAGLLAAGVFVLCVFAFFRQYARYGNKLVPELASSLKFVFIGLLVLLPIVLFFLLRAVSSHLDDTDLITPDYFGVDFSEEEKKKLRSVERPAYQPLAAVQPILSAPQESEDEAGNEEESGGSRFYMLTEIDTAYENYGPPQYDNEMTLREVCEEFRAFSAGQLKLYYDIEDIRRFIGGLAVTKLIILQGMSGTGKTSLAYAFGEFLDNKTVVVPIQPMWKERTDLVGYYNEFTRRFNETTLLYKMYEANCNDEIYITVLDEMNIARVEYYFAEFLSLLEIPNPDGRNLDVVADRWSDDPKLLQSNGKLRLPTNMWFVGTANNDDSTFSISDKVYDRAMVLNLDKKAIPFEAPQGRKRKLSAVRLNELFERAQREYDITDRNLRRLKELDKYMISTFHITFGNRIMKQIRSYVPVLVACGGTELEALDDILSRKVFRKLESKNPVYVKQMADGTCGYLDELFGEDKLPLCKEQIRLIEQNI
ncbi:MAG: AAA family ATPase [Clostridia bacterium]|nr:AAA family ATPase [Clostridia bacterium]